MKSVASQEEEQPNPEKQALITATRRIRDLVVFLPGLAAWVWAERRIAA